MYFKLFKTSIKFQFSATRGHLETQFLRKMRISPGLRPGPRWGSLQRSPRPPLLEGRGLAAPSPRTLPPLSALRASSKALRALHRPSPPMLKPDRRPWFCLKPSLECRQRWRRSDIGRQTVPYASRGHRKRAVSDC